MIFKRGLAASLLLLGACISTSALGENKDNAASMLDLANKGFVQSQHFMGEMYLFGKGVPKDESLALYWFNRAAEQGQIHSQYYSGLIYYKDPSPQSQALALDRFEQSARGGFAHAQFHLGQMIYQGKHVEQDLHAAISWFSLAAEQGLAKAQYNVGLMHYKGLGTDQDNEAALYWLTKACDKSFGKSCQAVKDLKQRIKYGEVEFD